MRDFIFYSLNLYILYLLPSETYGYALFYVNKKLVLTPVQSTGRFVHMN